MSFIKGTHQTVRFSRVVDGDTIRVFLPGAQGDESLRLLSLDTEESHAGGSKPVTPWGKQARQRAEAFFDGAAEVTIEFPGNEELTVCLRKYRGNYGRLLVYVYRDQTDFQETMIREGYSPYFNKYGNAQFGAHQRRYLAAEREAQRRHLGVWDQTGVNGLEQRNYAALATWWQLRARLIDDYRRVRALDASILNTRLDYEQLEAMALHQQRATVFTEMRGIRRVGGDGGLIGIGSLSRPFNLYLPDIDSPTGQALVHLLQSRYISGDATHPRRSYAYVTGQLSTYRERPQMVIDSPEQISDAVTARQDTSPPAAVVIHSLLPNPHGADTGFERVELRNAGADALDLQDWRLQDRAGNRFKLQGQLAAGQILALGLPPGKLPLNNHGDEISLFDAGGKLHNQVSYAAHEVVAGETILFG